MRRATTTSETRSTASAMDRHEQQEQRIRALEAAFALEQQRRDELEKKYARLKRRYVRLEVAHAQLQGVQDTSRNERSDGTPESSPLTGRNSTPSSTMDTQSPGSDVIDLTSPVGSRRVSLASPQRSPRLAHASAGMQNSQRSLSSDDFCGESPVSPMDRTAVQTVRSTSAGRPSARLSAQSSPMDSVAPPRPPTPPRVSGARRRQLEFYPPDPMSRPRPRPGPSASSPDEAAIRSSSRRRTRSPETSPAHPEQPEAIASPVWRTTPDAAAAASRHENDVEDSEEAASLALAQYLQQQENMAAMTEYEEHLQALELQQELAHHRQAAVSASRGNHTHHSGGVDPDNMTYEELLQLGEENGDVKKERWRQVAVQVLSSLPTHRWTRKSSDDLSCIICQYGFSVGDVALTLPCAHVFHEECVTGWVRENNSCPLCKLEIAII